MQAFLTNNKPTSFDKPSTSTGSITTPNNDKKRTPTPWVEKYRPKNVNDVVEQTEIVAVLKQCLDGSDLPNLLLYGPPGTGKTSTILAAARQLFGDFYKERILELNASDERGINVVRTKIKRFAQLTATGTRPDGKPCPPFKIIILDEADSMTNAAQAALRRTMEKESRTTRFCLVCNYVSRIIEPITSRCTKFRFKSLGEEKIIERLNFICTTEKLKINENVLKIIFNVSGGDLRRAITTLQSCYRLKGEKYEVTENDILEMSGVVPEKYLIEFFKICKSGVYKDLENFIQMILNEAYSIEQLLEQFNEFTLRHPDITNMQKSLICERLGQCIYRLQDGGSEYLQIMDLGCHIITTLKK